MPLAARAVWLRLRYAFLSHGIAELRFGPAKPASVAQLAAIVGAPEDEVSAALVFIVGHGLMTWEKNGTLVCPKMRAAAHRSAVNRENGLKGGRPARAKADA